VCTPIGVHGADENATINLPDFDANIPLEPVGRWRRQSISFQCTANAPWNNQYAVSFAPTAHTAAITNTGQTAIRDTGSGPFPVFSTPQLGTLGLGYILYWHTTSNSETQLTPGQMLSNVNGIIVGNGFLNITASSFVVKAAVWMHYVKISPLAAYETAHAITPQPSPLASFFVTDSTTPTPPPASALIHLSVPTPTLTLTRRTCTTPSPTYDLGAANFITDFPTIGSASTTHVEFTLTFNCPHGYNFVGISFNPVEGAANEALHPGVMNSNLPGVGVQLLTRLPELNYPANEMSTLLPDWQPVKFNKPYWLRQYLRPSPGNPDIRGNYSETFRARYYRTGNTTSNGGQMQEAVWVHMVYK